MKKASECPRDLPPIPRDPTPPDSDANEKPQRTVSDEERIAVKAEKYGRFSSYSRRGTASSTDSYAAFGAPDHGCHNTGLLLM